MLSINVKKQLLIEEIRELSDEQFKEFDKEVKSILKPKRKKKRISLKGIWKDVDFGSDEELKEDLTGLRIELQEKILKRAQ
ncbi:MAG: hypothetical protein SFU91_04000 [Chloroherpetonaceae bacterium]|nr:hypothetical protein [Chloroherpetonaceae bacterium]